MRNMEILSEGLRDVLWYARLAVEYWCSIIAFDVPSMNFSYSKAEARKGYVCYQIIPTKSRNT